MAQPNNKAVILLSGGLDSATTAAIAISKGFDCYALIFSYGQRHKIELEAAEKVADFLKIKELKTIHIVADIFANSSLINPVLNVPKERDRGHLSSDIPNTYVPVRNLIFLSYALAYAETIGAFDIFIGVNCLDYSGYPDCRPEFIASFAETANLASATATGGKRKFAIQTPIMRMTKAQIIKTGASLGFDYSITHSCYDPIGVLACGKCDSCILRKEGFKRAKVDDPTEYAK